MLLKNPFLQKDNYDKALYWCLLTTLLSLAFSIRFLNSLSIFILVFITTLHPLRISFLKKALHNPYFLACIALFAVKLAGLFYTNYFNESLRQVGSKIILVAIPFFFCANNIISATLMRRLMFPFSIALFAVSLVCLLYASFIYGQEHDISVFFYHELVRPVKHHAVLFSFFLFFTIVYWMEEGLNLSGSINERSFLRGLVIFFFLFILLLASKLVIAISFLYLILFGIRSFLGKKAIFLFALFIAGLVLTLAVTKNPIKQRFEDLTSGSFSLFKQEKFSPGVYFNGLQFRLLIWRFTYEILNEKKAWLLGVSTGDAQVELNKKYVASNVYQGNGKEDKKGYLVFHYHNVFLQTAIESGLIGLFMLISVIVIFIAQAVKRKRRPTLIFFGAILAFCFTESVLSAQYTILLFMFFPLLSLNTQPSAKNQL